MTSFRSVASKAYSQFFHSSPIHISSRLLDKGRALDGFDMNTGVSYLVQLEKKGMLSFRMPSHDILSTKIAEHYYIDDVVRNSEYTRTANDISEELSVGDSGIFYIGIDPSLSMFEDTDMYNKTPMAQLVDAINYHPCAVTNLGDGRYGIQLGTHTPNIKYGSFEFVSHIDLEGKQRDQYVMTQVFEVPGRMITYLKEYPVCNMSLRNDLLSSNSVSTVITEESLLPFFGDIKIPNGILRHIKKLMVEDGDVIQSLLSLPG
jgi:hypothetical protein